MCMQHALHKQGPVHGREPLPRKDPSGHVTAPHIIPDWNPHVNIKDAVFPEKNLFSRRDAGLLASGNPLTSYFLGNTALFLLLS